MTMIFAFIALLFATVAQATNPLAGTWVIQEAEDPGNHLSISEGQRFTLTLAERSDTEMVLDLSVHIANNFKGELRVLGSVGKVGTNNIKVSGLASTKMLAPPDRDPWEQYLLRSFPTMHELILEENGMLTLRGTHAVVKCAPDVSGSS
eukprot:CAMPEP_0116852544 /NCGR_PEP_ID=MMETSP0418-20121206/17363_1 /TAXON_ID=1158023 /ORGANISM="Astrosyne radiata, Strain 13vi08-1A" /LENGTH=148 /DNA_ID=CAMNT_0004484741 /DNA_START=1039 /DNA_END=1485 /DNA_ORIENTATION=+